MRARYSGVLPSLQGDSGVLPSLQGDSGGLPSLQGDSGGLPSLQGDSVNNPVLANMEQQLMREPMRHRKPAQLGCFALPK